MIIVLKVVSSTNQFTYLSQTIQILPTSFGASLQTTLMLSTLTSSLVKLNNRGLLDAMYSMMIQQLEAENDAHIQQAIDSVWNTNKYSYNTALTKNNQQKCAILSLPTLQVPTLNTTYITNYAPATLSTSPISRIRNTLLYYQTLSQSYSYMSNYHIIARLCTSLLKSFSFSTYQYSFTSTMQNSLVTLCLSSLDAILSQTMSSYCRQLSPSINLCLQEKLNILNEAQNAWSNLWLSQSNFAAAIAVTSQSSSTSQTTAQISFVTSMLNMLSSTFDAYTKYFLSSPNTVYANLDCQYSTVISRNAMSESWSYNFNTVDNSAIVVNSNWVISSSAASTPSSTLVDTRVLLIAKSAYFHTWISLPYQLLTSLMSVSRTSTTSQAITTTSASSPSMIITFTYKTSLCNPFCAACNMSICSCSNLACIPVCYMLDSSLAAGMTSASWKLDVNLKTFRRPQNSTGITYVDCVATGISAGTFAVFGATQNEAQIVFPTSSSTGTVRLSSSSTGTNVPTASSSTAAVIIQPSSSSSTGGGGIVNPTSSVSQSLVSSSSSAPPVIGITSSSSSSQAIISVTSSAPNAVAKQGYNATVLLDIDYNSIADKLPSFMTNFTNEISYATGLAISQISVLAVRANDVILSRSHFALFSHFITMMDTSGTYVDFSVAPAFSFKLVSPSQFYSNLTFQLATGTGPLFSTKYASKMVSQSVVPITMYLCSDLLFRVDCSKTPIAYTVPETTLLGLPVLTAIIILACVGGALFLIIFCVICQCVRRKLSESQHQFDFMKDPKQIEKEAKQAEKARLKEQKRLEKEAEAEQKRKAAAEKARVEKQAEADRLAQLNPPVNVHLPQIEPTFDSVLMIPSHIKDPQLIASAPPNQQGAPTRFNARNMHNNNKMHGQHNQHPSELWIERHQEELEMAEYGEPNSARSIMNDDGFQQPRGSYLYHNDVMSSPHSQQQPRESLYDDMQSEQMNQYQNNADSEYAPPFSPSNSQKPRDSYLYYNEVAPGPYTPSHQNESRDSYVHTYGYPADSYQRGQPRDSYMQGQPRDSYMQGQPRDSYMQGQPRDSHIHGQPRDSFSNVSQPGAYPSVSQPGAGSAPSARPSGVVPPPRMSYSSQPGMSHMNSPQHAQSQRGSFAPRPSHAMAHQSSQPRDSSAAPPHAGAPHLANVFTPVRDSFQEPSLPPRDSYVKVAAPAILGPKPRQQSQLPPLSASAVYVQRQQQKESAQRQATQSNNVVAPPSVRPSVSAPVIAPPNMRPSVSAPVMAPPQARPSTTAHASSQSPPASASQQLRPSVTAPVVAAPSVRPSVSAPVIAAPMVRPSTVAPPIMASSPPRPSVAAPSMSSPPRASVGAPVVGSPSVRPSVAAPIIAAPSVRPSNSVVPPPAIRPSITNGNHNNDVNFHLSPDNQQQPQKARFVKKM